MRKLVFYIFIGLCCDSFAQDTLSNWSLGVVGGVEQSGRLLSDAGGDQDVVDYWNSLEQNVWRLTGGVRAERKLNNRFSLFTGLNYANRGYQIDTLEDAGLNSLDFHFRSLEVPVGIIYSGKLSGKNSLFAASALTVSYAWNDVVFYQKNGQTAQFEMKGLTNVKPIGANVSAALGIRRSITETANADFYFSGNQSLIPLAEGTLERRFYAFGFFVAVTSRF